jgi:hypothetical protein
MEVIPAAIVVFERPVDLDEAELSHVAAELMDWHLFMNYPFIGAMQYVALSREDWARLTPDDVEAVLGRLGVWGERMLRMREAYDFHWQEVEDSVYGTVRLLWVTLAGAPFPPANFGAQTLNY